MRFILAKALLLVALLPWPAMAEDAPAQSTLILYRGKGYEGIVHPFVRPWAYVNDQFIGSCHKGTKITLAVPPGTYAVHTQSESPNGISVSLEPGQTLCVRCTIAPGIVMLNWRLTIDEPDKCQKVIATFREQPRETADSN